MFTERSYLSTGDSYRHSVGGNRGRLETRIVIVGFSPCRREERSDETISEELSELATPRQVGAHNDMKRKDQIDMPFSGHL
jgi:hypothetical protein